MCVIKIALKPPDRNHHSHKKVIKLALNSKTAEYPIEEAYASFTVTLRHSYNIGNTQVPPLVERLRIGIVGTS